MRWQAPEGDGPPIVSLLVSRPVGNEVQERRPRQLLRIDAALRLHRQEASE
jgi:hypothetical protein